MADIDLQSGCLAPIELQLFVGEGLLKVVHLVIPFAHIMFKLERNLLAYIAHLHAMHKRGAPADGTGNVDGFSHFCHPNLA